MNRTRKRVSLKPVFVITILSILLMSGCRFTYSPPVRSSTFGAPGHLAGGEAEAGLGGSIYIPYKYVVRPGGNPSFAFGITDWFALDLGAEIATEAMMGFGGLRFTVMKPHDYRERFSLDIAFGGGGGAGGELCSNASNGYYDDNDDWMFPDWGGVPCPDDRLWDNVHWHERYAYGGYITAGMGWRIVRWVDVFLRPRVQLSKGVGVPLTTWANIQVGPHITPIESLEIHVSAGPSAYFNEYDYWFQLLIEFGLAYKFSTS